MHLQTFSRRVKQFKVLRNHFEASLFQSYEKESERGVQLLPPSTNSGQCMDFQQNIASFWPESTIFRLETMRRLSFNVLTYFGHFTICGCRKLVMAYIQMEMLKHPLNNFNLHFIDSFFKIQKNDQKILAAPSALGIWRNDYFLSHLLLEVRPPKTFLVYTLLSH